MTDSIDSDYKEPPTLDLEGMLREFLQVNQDLPVGLGILLNGIIATIRELEDTRAFR